jgi:hypothetical protein
LEHEYTNNPLGRFSKIWEISDCVDGDSAGGEICEICIENSNNNKNKNPTLTVNILPLKLASL